MNKHTEVCLLALPIFILACIGIWLLSYQPKPGLLDNETPYIRHFLHSNLLQVQGPLPKTSTGFEESKLLPGDLILGHHQNGTYGYWAHCAIYLGNNRCTQQNLSEGMFEGSTYDFKDFYERVIILRASLSEAQRQQICEFVRQRSGAVFDMSARKQDPRLWTCAKLCWAAYKQVGIDLCPESNYVIPDFLSQDKRLQQVAVYPMEQLNDPAR